MELAKPTQMSSKKLTEELFGLGLSTKGKRPTLVKRLVEARRSKADTSIRSDVNHSEVCDEDAELAELEKQIQQKKDAIARREKIENLKIKNRDLAVQLESGEVNTMGVDVSVAPPDAAAPLSTTRSVPMQCGAQSDSLAILAHSLALSRLPIAEPPVFAGNPLEFGRWASAIDRMFGGMPLSEVEKLHIMERYLSGQAKTAVESLFLLSNPAGYLKAREILKNRYGRSFVVTDAFREKLNNWPKINGRDGMGLRNFSDYLQQCLAAVSIHKELNILEDIHEIRKLAQKLPEWAVSRWARITVDLERKGDCPTFSRFVSFVTEEADVACDPSVLALRSRPSSKQAQSFAISTIKTSVEVDPVNSMTACSFCKSSAHHMRECKAFKAKSKEEKKETVQKFWLCFACLEKGHRASECVNRATCRICKKYHPTSLHQSGEVNKKPSPTPPKEQISPAKSEALKNTLPNRATCAKVSINHTAHMTSMVVPVWLSSKREPGREHLVYALIDTQSDATFIVQNSADSLTSKPTNVTLQLSTLTKQGELIQCKKYCDLQVRGYNSSVFVDLPDTYSRECIPVDLNHIPTAETAKPWPHLAHLAGCMPTRLDCPVGLLIGFNCVQAMTPREIVSGPPSEPFGIRTDLGWSIVGGPSGPSDLCHVNCVVSSHSDVRQEQLVFTRKVASKEVFPIEKIQRSLERDFAGDDILSSTSESVEDRKFLEILGENICHDNNGYCTMPLPFRSRPSGLYGSNVARHRFRLLEKKFERDEGYRSRYTDFMNAIIENGEAEIVPPEESECADAWYIPHFGVYHPKKPDKIRVVFDCSAKDRGLCLNDHLLQGPDLVNSLLGVLLRFRGEKVAISCDVEKMFHQFRVTKTDRDFLRFLWYDSRGNVAVYRMCVHLFGATSSPGCATFGFRESTRQHVGNDPDKMNAWKFIRHDFYVDDGLTSVADVDSAVKLIEATRQLCSESKMHLHKFVSTHAEALSALPASEKNSKVDVLTFYPEENIPERALGLTWDLKHDVFRFPLVAWKGSLTRRSVLSEVMSFYDPLGFIAPCLLPAKGILQELCRAKATWDDPLPIQLAQKWATWRESMGSVPDVAVPRRLRPDGFEQPRVFELHHFSDASESGYGACSYVRMMNSHGDVHVTFMLGKARVAPLKTISIPRLELQGAVTATRLSCILRKEHAGAQFTGEYFWTDSKAVLGYVTNEKRRFKTYVANRVGTIHQRSSPKDWHYVRSESNPADHASRGLLGKDLYASSWLEGPRFLWMKNVPFSSEKGSLPPGDPDVKLCLTSTLTQTQTFSTWDERLQRFSSWESAVRGVTRLRELLLKIKGTAENAVVQKILTEKFLVKTAQEDYFSAEKARLSKGDCVKKDSPLFKLDTFIDIEGLVRIGGRLSAADLSLDEKHPILLPRKSRVSYLLLDRAHRAVAHQGRSFSLHRIRSEGYWPLGGRITLSTLISKCTTCRKTRGLCCEQKMANLPPDRTEPCPPFTNCGCDCFGPYLVKQGRKQIKRYGVLFTCLSSRAVHIEVVDDLSTDSFINAYRCLEALRGPVKLLRCDRGTNFVGADNEFKRNVSNFLTQRYCVFEFNSPSASHTGGVWERMIRSARNVLAGVLARSPTDLTERALHTLFYEVTYLINSRPLSSCDLTDKEVTPISPNLLLTMKTNLVFSPPGEFTSEATYSKKQWKRVQMLAQQFWDRWAKTYLNDLQSRQKWVSPKQNLTEGAIVLVVNEQTARGEWPLGRVVSTKVSDDGLVRSVRVQLGTRCLASNGKRTSKLRELERPIQKIVLLVE